MSCVICFDNLTTGTWCPLKNCDSKVCVDCTKEMLNFCLSENQMITCPKSGCSTQYILSCMPQQIDVRELYQDVCVNYLINFTKLKVNEKNKYRQVIDKIREEKIEFMRKTHCAAISLVINVAYEKELKKVDKNNNKTFDKLLKGRRCIGVLCKGIMLETPSVNGMIYKCEICFTEFCKECEIAISNTHICKEDDVESVKAVNSMIKCPTCALPVIKSVGCNHITCAICRTNFDYITGEKSIDGNHTHDDAIRLREHNTLFELYSSQYKNNKDLLTLLVKIDTMQPKLVNISHIVNFIQKHPDLTKETKYKLTMLYSSYIKSCHKAKIYRNLILKINSHHINETLNVRTLNACLEEM